MASYRIGIGSFNLKDGNIGIGNRDNQSWKLKSRRNNKDNRF